MTSKPYQPVTLTPSDFTEPGPVVPPSDKPWLMAIKAAFDAADAAQAKGDAWEYVEELKARAETLVVRHARELVEAALAKEAGR